MERICVTAKLNGTTLQFDHEAYKRLEVYLAEAVKALEGNPDRNEILADLEQAVADQCKRRMRVDQPSVSLRLLEAALEEIGPVQPPEAEPAPSAPKSAAPRRLEQVSEGALISGVCQGLSRYMGVDVTLLRVIAILLLLFSGGAIILVYLVLMLLLPYAAPQPGGEPVRKIPAKCREFVTCLRSKLSTATD